MLRVAVEGVEANGQAVAEETRKLQASSDSCEGGPGEGQGHAYCVFSSSWRENISAIAEAQMALSRESECSGSE